MIRDPSDGSVRDTQHRPEPLKSKAIVDEKPVFGTGLPEGSSKPEHIERLNKSREWLKQYRKAVDDLNRMNDKGEIPKPRGTEHDG